MARFLCAMKQSSRRAWQKRCTAKLPASGFVSRTENTRDFSVVEIREKRDRFVLKFGKLWGA
jgi:hypothetical protein